MDALLAESQTPPGTGDTVEGPVIAIGSGKIYINLPPFGTGIIYGREYLAARDVLRKVALGDTVSAKIVGGSHKEGYIELSLKEARQAMIWSDAERAIAGGTVFEIPVKDANKGGLILAWQYPGLSPCVPIEARALSEGRKRRKTAHLGRTQKAHRPESFGFHHHGRPARR